MSTPTDPVSLAQWRRKVAEAYAKVRQEAAADPAGAWRAFRLARDELFKYHTQSPLDAQEERDAFNSLRYFEYDPAWRVTGQLDYGVSAETFHVHLAADGDLRYTRVARAHFPIQEKSASLSLFWIEGYGGGLFLPFADATNGESTFGGGRYLFDTIKGVDLGIDREEILLDFNFAYNPSCAYDSHWVCPLSPTENRLPFAVKAGEMKFAWPET